MILIVAFSFLNLMICTRNICFVTSLKMFVFLNYGSLEADICQKMPFEVSFSRDENNYIYCVI